MNEDFIVTLVFGIICLLVGFLSAKFGDRINQQLREDRHDLECIRCYKAGLEQGYNRKITTLYSKTRRSFKRE